VTQWSPLRWASEPNGFVGVELGSSRQEIGALAQRKSGSARRRGASLARLARKRVRDGTKKAAEASLARARDIGDGARKAMAPGALPIPYLSVVKAPRGKTAKKGATRSVRVASYNVHRWSGFNGRGKPDLGLAGEVIAAVDADVIALQEVLRPTGEEGLLEALADDLGFHLVFAANRVHKRGELGNAILSRFPTTSVSVLDLFSSRIERRCALAAGFDTGSNVFGVVATHLSLVDRTRQKQVEMLLDHPQWNAGPAVLLGDINAWRDCKASQSLESKLHRHNNFDWPATFPSSRPILALDRIYASGARVVSLRSYDTPAARRASDHLPVVARIRFESGK